MLIQFRFKNHKCFYDETILDLMATKEKRHLETTFDINGNKILPVIAIHGANASGKSSVLEALNFMFSFIKNSLYFDVKKDLPFYPFAFSKTSFKNNSEYEISVCLNNYEYRYGFSISKNKIEEEWLYKKKFSLNTKAKQKIIFERLSNSIEFGSSYNKYKKIWELFSNTSDIDNKLLIFTFLALKEEEGELRDIYDYIDKYNFKIESIFQNETSIAILKKESSIFDEFQKIIREFDPCLLGIKIEKKIENGEEIYNINGIHKNTDNKSCTLLPLNNESDGTIKIFNIMPMILYNLEKGGLLCIDELDIKLHPLLFKKIVNMYKDKNINKKNAQLIFTAHSTFVFNSENLRRDQIYLVEKDLNGKSKLYSLSEFRNLRVDADYEKKYLTGQFGAIPYDDE